MKLNKYITVNIINLINKKRLSKLFVCQTDDSIVILHRDLYLISVEYHLEGIWIFDYISNNNTLMLQYADPELIKLASDFVNHAINYYFRYKYVIVLSLWLGDVLAMIKSFLDNLVFRW